MKLRIDSTSKKADFFRLKLANDSKKFVYLATGRNGDIVTLNNIAIGPTDFWIDLRLEYYPAQNVMKMYAGGQYKGEFSDTFNISSAYVPNVSALGGAINEAAIFLSNSTDSRYGGFGVGLDDLKLYTASIDYVPTTLGKTYEDFETRSESYEKLLSDGSVSTSVKFGSAMSFEYGGSTNAAGTTVSVETAPDGNRYVRFDINKRVSSTDASYTPIFYTQKFADNANAYLVEMTMKVNTSSTGGFNMLLVGGKVRGELYVRTGSGAVNLDGIRLAALDEWFDLRLVYYPGENVIQVFVKNEGEGDFSYRGDIVKFSSSTITDADGKTVLDVGALGVVDRLTCSLPNSSYEFDLCIDNVAVSDAELEFVDLTDTLKYKLTYTVDGNTYYVDSISPDTLVTLPDAPVKDGYTFDGWYLDSKLTKPFTRDYYLTTTLRADAKLYAKFTEIVAAPEEYTVKFIVDGEEYHSVTVLEGQSVAMPLAPAKDGYTFDGWFFEGGAKLTEDYLASRDVSVYAQFSEIIVLEEYTVIFVLDGAEYHSVTVTEGQSVSIPAAPTKDGYTFDGWFFEGGAKLTEDYLVSRDVSVYAQFSEIIVPDPVDPPMADGDEPMIDADEENAAPDLDDVDQWKIQ